MKPCLWSLWALCLLVSPMLYLTAAAADDTPSTASTEEWIRVVVSSLTPTNFSFIADESGTVSVTRSAIESVGEGQPVAAMTVTNVSILQMSTSDSKSASSSSGTGLKTSAVGVATSTSSQNRISSIPMSRAMPTTSIPLPGSYSPPPIAPSSSRSHHQSTSGHPRSSSTHQPPSTTTTEAATTSTMKSHPVMPSGCGPPVTVTMNCPLSPSSVPTCSAGGCGSTIGLSLGIGIPATAIITFLLTSLSCLCCQRVKKKHSYIQLAPTVYFDEEEHD